MLRWLIRKKLASEEHRLGESLDYCRHILDVSLGAFFKFAKILPFSAYRRVLPPDMFHVACLVAVRDEDCGPCVQIVVNLARADGVDPAILAAALAGDIEKLPPELAEVYRFAESVVQAADDDLLRQRILARWGERGLVELAFGMAGGRVFPIVKRTLGFAKSCKLVTIRV